MKKPPSLSLIITNDRNGKHKQVRVKFVTKIPSIRVTETPVAVPESLQRYGLSEVVNHLLGRDPPTPFDMLVMGRFLRSSLASVMRKNVLSGEAVLEVEYLPALRQPTEAEHADQVCSTFSVSCLSFFPSFI